MRSCFLLVGALLNLAFAPAPFPKAVRNRDDLSRLQGQWKLISITDGGKRQPPGKQSWVISGNKLVSTLDACVEQWTITIDAKANPKSMDRRMPAEKGKYYLIKAAYSLVGDTLTVCEDVNDWWARPTDLSGTGDNHRLRVFQRVKH